MFIKEGMGIKTTIIFVLYTKIALKSFIAFLIGLFLYMGMELRMAQLK